MQTLGIIGFGSFGQFMTKYLKDHFEVSVYDSNDLSKTAKDLGVNWQTLEEITQNQIIILAIPLQYLEDLLKKIAHTITPGTLVIDVTSVKISPVTLMKKYLHEEVNIIATHPLFGPKSGANGIAGLKITLCDVRSTNLQYNWLKNFFANTLELDVIESTPEEHDREAGYVMGLTHFIGQALNHLEIPDCKQTTKTFQHLMQLREMLSQDSMDLFLTIQKDNPHAEKTRNEFYKTLSYLEEKIAE